MAPSTSTRHEFQECSSDRIVLLDSTVHDRVVVSPFDFEIVHDTPLPPQRPKEIFGHVSQHRQFVLSRDDQKWRQAGVDVVNWRSIAAFFRIVSKYGAE